MPKPVSVSVTPKIIDGFPSLVVESAIDTSNIDGEIIASEYLEQCVKYGILSAVTQWMDSIHDRLINGDGSPSEKPTGLLG